MPLWNVPAWNISAGCPATMIRSICLTEEENYESDCLEELTRMFSARGSSFLGFCTTLLTED